MDRSLLSIIFLIGVLCAVVQSQIVFPGEDQGGNSDSGSPNQGGGQQQGGPPNQGGRPPQGGPPNQGGGPPQGGPPNQGGGPPQGGPPNRGGPPQGGPPNQGGGPPQGGPPNQGGPQPQGQSIPPRRGNPSEETLVFPREERLPKKACTTFDGKDGVCILLVQCAIFSSQINTLSQSPCQITPEQSGVCCEKSPPPRRDPSKVVNKPPRRIVARPNINLNDINSAAENALQTRKKKKEFERELVFNNIVPDTNTPVFLHNALFDSTQKVVDKSDKAQVTLEATMNIIKDNNLSTEEGEFGLNEIDVSGTIIGDSCPVQPICPETKYRSIDGSCNNLRNKDWGQAATAFQRLLPPKYGDGTNLPRVGVNNRPMPSARLISQTTTITREENYRSFTLMIMQWGQFLDHDITHTPLSRGSGNSGISCCTNNGRLRPPQQLHPECFPIAIPETDSFYGQFQRTCMSFVRSLPAIRKSCKFGPREQMNQITAFIDASNVYGSDDDIAKSLREFQNGRLLINNHEGRHMLPAHPSALGCPKSRPPFCFKAGDVRVNEQPDLVVLHTVWMRQHNRIANSLAQINPGWSDEIIYQEARRIVGAQMQHITYNEYLPVVLGREFMTTFGLIPQTSGHTSNYVPTVDPTITNAFATAAYRYGHTMVSGIMKGLSAGGEVQREMPLSASQFAPFFLYDPGEMDSMIRGLVTDQSAKFDKSFSNEVTNRLFAGNSSIGLDLVALNIQRGRDHGLPSYNEWRKICNLPTASNFQDFGDVMSNADIQKLASVYNHVDDVDLFIGGILEKPKTGSLLGPTFICIVGDQFSRLRIGDRFYYENGQFASKFSESQLDQIRKTSLARILCDNSDNISRMQPLVFVNAGTTDGRRGVNGNEVASCDDDRTIPRMSLDPWINEPVWS